MKNSTATTNRLFARYKSFIATQSRKSTTQRDLIVTSFFKTGGHISAEELHGLIKKTKKNIGLATVYRTLKLLTEGGLAKEMRFNDGITRYEVEGPECAHHDHMVCLECGKVEEFENEMIEKLQKEVATKCGFSISDHKLELYGICKECS